MESTEFGANNDEDSKWLGGIFNLGQETAVEAERNSNFGGLIEIRLEDVPRYREKGKFEPSLGKGERNGRLTG